MKRRKLSLMLALFLTLLTPFTTSARGFTDTRGHWAERAIDYCASRGYIHGYPDGSFKPNQPITKVEYYTITNHANPDRVREEVSSTRFSDVSEGDWFYREVQRGIAMGYLENTTGLLNPNDAITREDAVRIFSFNRGFTPNEAPLARFTDQDQITAKYRGLVGAAVEQKIVVGYPDGRFGPKNSLTRGEVATLIAQAEQYGRGRQTAGQWHWSFPNGAQNFRSGYALLPADKKLVASTFTPKDAQEIYRSARNPWRGSCFGFASTAGLYRLGRFNIGDLNQPSQNEISRLQPQDNYLAQSRINLYQLSQTTQQFRNHLYERAYGYNYPVKNSTKDIQTITNRLMTMIDGEKSKNSTVQIALYSYPKFAHAVVGYDYEKTGNVVKVKVYDPNFPASTEGRSLVIDTGAGTIRYNGSNNAGAPTQLMNIQRMYLFPTAEFSQHFALRGGASRTYVNLYEAYPVRATVGGQTYTLDPEKGGEATLDGKTTVFALPDTTEPITLSGGGEVRLSILRGSSRQEIGAAQFTRAVVGSDSIALAGAVKDVDIAITRDNPPSTFPHDTVRIQGDRAEDLTLEADGGGYTLRGKSLKGLKISGAKYDTEEVYTIGSDATKLELRSQDGTFILTDEAGRRYDREYVDGSKSDTLIGSWHGKSTFKFENTGKTIPLDVYLYITKVGEGKYQFRERNVTQDGSEYTTISAASYDGKTKVIYQEGSTRVENIKGVFTGQGPHTKPSKWTVEGEILRNIDFTDDYFVKY